jgi:ABC-type transport system substrate-binding protein
MKIRRAWPLVGLIFGLVAIVGCGGSDAVTKEDISSAVQQAVAAAQQPPAPAAPAGPTAAEISALVASAVVGAVGDIDIPEGVSATQIQTAVQKAVDAAAGEAVTAADIQKAVDAVVGEGLSASDVEAIVNAAVMAIPTPATVQVVKEVRPEPKGEFSVGLSLLKPLVQLPSLDSAGTVGGHGIDFQIYEGVFRSLLRPSDVPPPPDIYGPEIAESWTVAQDLSKITFAIRKGIPWHDGWGRLTAEDVVWTYNNAFEQGSLNNGAESVPPGHKAGWDLFDENTAIQNVEEGKFSPTWGVWQGGMGHLDGTFGVVCKHCYEEMGEDKFLTTPVGTGAFKVIKWAGHDELVLEAVPDHWQQTANVKTVRVFELPEQATMEAALRTGEVDFAPIVARRLKEIIPATNGTALKMGMPWPNSIIFSGNYWGATCPACPEGEQDLMANPRRGYTPDAEHPWIGRYGDDESMENARLVRTAMNIVIDRESILENVLGGFGEIGYSPMHTQFPPGTKYYRDEWTTPYDPDLAREMLAEAGYPDGFPVEFYAYVDTPTFWDPEVSAAVGEMWRKELNLDVTIDRSAYATRRPSMVTKDINIPWVQGWGLPPGSGKAIAMCANPGIVEGFELPDDICDIGYAVDTEPDLEKRILLNAEMNDYLSYWTLMPTIVVIPTYWVHLPTVVEWEPYWGKLFSNPVSVVISR